MTGLLDYIYHKLELTGTSRSILGGRAVSVILGYSEENASKTHNLMIDVITIGVQQDQYSVNAEVIMVAAITS